MQILSRKMRPAILKALFVPLFVAVLFGLAWAKPLSAQQVDIHGPAGSEDFGDDVITLPNGNFVVVDTNYDEADVEDIGAVYLYSGADLSLISMLKGGSEGDYVGSGVTVLSNGNFVVRSRSWDNPSGPVWNAGAVTWCDGVSGCTGLVTETNSLVGGTDWDLVGDTDYYKPGFSGVVALSNGHYVVKSPDWGNPSGPMENAGAVTWCDGDSGCTGLVTAANSLIGGTADDEVGIYELTLLSNDHYVVRTPFWDNPNGPVENVGAVTWCDGAGGCRGLVTAANSLVGGSAEDRVGRGVTALSSGRYAVRSPSWSNPSGPVRSVGAVTWCDGASGCTGLVTAANSLVGGSLWDRVGGTTGSEDDSPYVTTLSNGNYVVRSPDWNNPSGDVFAGAVTWCDGASGCTGLVTEANSLVGGTTGDDVGHGVTALTNGHYVVSSPYWDNPDVPVVSGGAVTWCDGADGCIGLVTEANSLVGGTRYDEVGSSGVTALTNGHYVVNSPEWTNPSGPVWRAGAISYGHGDGGTIGNVTPANSVLGMVTDSIGDWDFDGMGERLVVGQRNIVTLFPASIELGMEKSASQASAYTGEILTYTVVVTNSGSIDLSGGIISDTLPSVTKWLADSATLQPSTAGTLGSPPQLVGGLYITAGTSVTLTYQVEVTGDHSIITNTASVAATRHLTPVVDTATLRVDQSFGQEIFLPFVYR